MQCEEWEEDQIKEWKQEEEEALDANEGSWCIWYNQDFDLWTMQMDTELRDSRILARKSLNVPTTGENLENWTCLHASRCHVQRPACKKACRD